MRYPWENASNQTIGCACLARKIAIQGPPQNPNYIHTPHSSKTYSISTPRTSAHLLGLCERHYRSLSSLGAGIIARRLLKTEPAIADLSLAIRIDPGNLAFRQVRGTICRHIGRLDIAVKDVQRITELVPGNETFREILLKVRQQLE